MRSDLDALRSGHKAAEPASYSTHPRANVLPPPKVGKSMEVGVDGRISCNYCYQRIEYFSVGPCNHATCYDCILRRRALFGDIACMVCEKDMPLVFFTNDANKRFLQYVDKWPVQHDQDLGILYTAREILDAVQRRLQFDCPDCFALMRTWKDL
ncbi:hypothetical protein LTR53_018990, partial [Teratosphaeriaceae sp. CCFEE 6253]